MTIQELEPKFDMWSSIHESKKTTGGDMVAPPYVHPLVRRSMNSLSPRSLEICTESLGSETGSDGYSDIDDFFSNSPATSDDYDNGAVEDGEDEVDGLEGMKEEKKKKRRELEMVNYHCSIGRRSRVMSFPPPLPSISRRDGPCVHLRSHRRDGRLVVQAVPVPSQNYLHCHREDGRLLLTFVETTFKEIYPQIEDPIPCQEDEDIKFEDDDDEEEEDEDEIEEEEEEVEEEEEEEVEEEEEEEVEVEVVNRGIVVEVKMRKPKTQNRGGLKPHKSSLVINKFVSGTPIDNKIKEPNNSNLKNNEEDNKLLFSSKKVMNREALLHQVRRCSYQQRPLFIWERCCVATS